MKRIIDIFLLITLLLISLGNISCSSTSNPNTEAIKGDWPYYNSYGDLCAASALIIEGRVLSVSYSVIDYKNAQMVNDCKNDLDNKMLYTVYAVEVIDVLKGDAGQTITLTVMGGRDDRDLDLQKGVLDNSGLSVKFEHLPVLIENYTKLTEGDVCLFCLHRFGNYFSPINMDQFVFSKESSDYTMIKELLLNEQ